MSAPKPAPISPQQPPQIQQVFQSEEFQQRLMGRVTPVEADAIVHNPARLQVLARDVALDTVVDRTFGGSGVPQQVQQGFRGGAEAWALRQARVNGGTAAGWLEKLFVDPNGSAYRAELLRPVVAEHLGGGNERLQKAVAAQLRPLGESELKNLVAPGSGGVPQQATISLLRNALVAQWAEDYKLSAQDRYRLGQAIDQRLKNKSTPEQRAELVNLANSNQIRDTLVRQAQGLSSRILNVPQSLLEGGLIASQALQTTTDALNKSLQTAGLVPENLARLYPAFDQVLSNVQQMIPPSIVNNPVTTLVGDTFNTAADWYRGLQRGLQNNPIVIGTLDRYQAAVRQARYFPQHFAAKVALDQRRAAANSAVDVYEKAGARIEDTQNKIGSLTRDLESAIRQYDAAKASGDAAAQQKALAQINTILLKLEKGSAQAAQVLSELRGRVETQLGAGRAMLDQQRILLAQRQRAYDAALQQSQGVETPQVLQARKALAEAKLPFELEQTVRDRRQAYDDLLAKPNAESADLERARRAYEQSKTALARHNLSGKDAVTDAWIDRDQGLEGQLQTLETLWGRLRQIEDTVSKEWAPGSDPATLSRAIDVLEEARDLVQRGADHARAKRHALDGAQIVVDQEARIDQLHVNAEASRSELSRRLGRIGFAHSQAKDIYDGKGKGRIDGLSNRAKINRATNDVAQFSIEVDQWKLRLDTLENEIASLQADPNVTQELKTQQLQTLQSQRVNALELQTRAQGRLEAAQRRLQLEQRAAEPRSIKVRVDDLQAKAGTSQQLLKELRAQHGQKQAALEQSRQALETQLQNTSDPGQRQQLQARLDSMKATSEANDYALARAELIHTHTEALFEDAKRVQQQASQTGGVTLGKTARNVVRSTIVAAVVAKALAVVELVTGIKEPDKPEDLLPLLQQMNLPGSESPLKVKDFKLVAAGVYQVSTVQGPVYVWRTRGTFSDLVVVAQPVPQGRGLLAAPIFNGGTVGRASPSVQKGSDGLYLTLDSQRIALAGVTFGSVFHPDPSSTALNWWETIKIEVGTYGLATRFNSASTNPQTGAKVPMLEIVGSNSIKAPVRVQLPFKVPYIGNTLEFLPTIGFSITLKNSLGIGQLSLVHDPEMGVGQQSDRTSSYAFKFDGKQPMTEWNPGTQPYGFFGTAIRLEKNYYAKYDPRNEGHWLMNATEPLEQAFDVATFKWIANPLSELIKSAVDGVRYTVSPPPSGLKPSVAEAYIRAARRWAEEKVKNEGGTVEGHLEMLMLFGSDTRAQLLRPIVAEDLGGGVPVLVNAFNAELAGFDEGRLLELLDLLPRKVGLVRDVLVNVWARDFALTESESKDLAALVGQELHGKNLHEQYALLIQLASAPEARRALVEKVNQAPTKPAG
ncbi:MAG: hypothetical protein ING30_12875 [Burkholderiales bacterium]|nr:hypothetical protein [Burkholderiales bacterium]